MDINISIKDRLGKVHNILAPTDINLNIMELVKMNDLVEDGTIGLCGGMCMCASCQCYILNSVKIPEISDEESAMLSEAFNLKNNSRLGCQIFITPELEGLEIELSSE